MLNTFARRVRGPGYEIGADRAAYDEFCAAWAAAWGTPESPVVALYTPSQLGDEGFLRWAQRFERQSSTPHDMLANLALAAGMDVRAVLPAIRVPTLVVHARQDLVVDVEPGRYLAAHIPGARLFEYDGEHLPVFVGVDETVDAIEEFVTGAVHRPAGDRMLATVLFTDIVGSTERAAALGDRDWKSLIDRHDEVLRDVLARHGGVEVDTTGAGMLSRVSAMSAPFELRERRETAMLAMFTCASPRRVPSRPIRPGRSSFTAKSMYGSRSISIS